MRGKESEKKGDGKIKSDCCVVKEEEKVEWKRVKEEKGKGKGKCE